MNEMDAFHMKVLMLGWEILIKERVVAKHAARIALCFTSTDKTISGKEKTCD